QSIALKTFTPIIICKNSGAQSDKPCRLKQICEFGARSFLALKLSSRFMFATTTFATLPKNYNFRHVRDNIHIYCKSGNSISLKLNMFIDTKVLKVSV